MLRTGSGLGSAARAAAVRRRRRKASGMQRRPPADRCLVSMRAISGLLLRGLHARPLALLREPSTDPRWVAHRQVRP